MTGDKITLGFAGISDSESISQIEKQCFSEPWSASAVQDFLGYNFNRILCAVIDGRVSGYVSFTFIPDEIEIQNVAVAPELRRKGIADKIMHALDKYAADKSAEKISLEVRVSNFAAISLYQKHGFLKTDIRKNFYRHPNEDACVMIKEFNTQQTTTKE